MLVPKQSLDRRWIHPVWSFLWIPILYSRLRWRNHCPDTSFKHFLIISDWSSVSCLEMSVADVIWDKLWPEVFQAFVLWTISLVMSDAAVGACIVEPCVVGFNGWCFLNRWRSALLYFLSSAEVAPPKENCFMEYLGGCSLQTPSSANHWIHLLFLRLRFRLQLEI